MDFFANRTIFGKIREKNRKKLDIFEKFLPFWSVDQYSYRQMPHWQIINLLFSLFYLNVLFCILFLVFWRFFHASVCSFFYFISSLSKGVFGFYKKWNWTLVISWPFQIYFIVAWKIGPGAVFKSILQIRVLLLHQVLSGGPPPNIWIQCWWCRLALVQLLT